MSVKKLICTVAVGCAAALLAACGETQPDRYGELNRMMNAEYARVVLTVTETFDEGTSLTAEYIITDAEEGKKIEYSIEQLSAFGDLLDDPSDFKTVLTGEAIVKGGTVVSVTGDEAGLPAVLGSGLTFREEYFSNISLTEESIEADVTDTKGFFGETTNCNDMKLSAGFGTEFRFIQIVYTSAGGSEVEYYYRFEV